MFSYQEIVWSKKRWPHAGPRLFHPSISWETKRHSSHILKKNNSGQFFPGPPSTMGSNSNTVHAVSGEICHATSSSWIIILAAVGKQWNNCFCHVRIQAPLVFTLGIHKHNIEARTSNIKFSFLRVDRKQVDRKQKSWRKENQQKKTTTHNSNNKGSSKKKQRKTKKPTNK